MKMSILEIGYKNIRKITELKLSFVRKDGVIIKNNFIMMANGTGKTTTMTLIKGLLDGTATEWPVDTVRSFAPTTINADSGEFSITVKFDDKQYKYFLVFDYKKGTVVIETSAIPKGRETGIKLPEAVKGIFTPEFVRRFVFDGEQAAKSMDSSSNEAEETIKYLYRLDKLDEIIALNKRLLVEIQDAEGNKGSTSSLSNLRTRQAQVSEKKERLLKRIDSLRKSIKDYEAEKKEKEEQREEIDKNYDRLNKEKNDISEEQTKNKAEIDRQIDEIIRLIKSPYLISEEFCERMYSLGNSMTKLKLPKTISKDFFVELANAQICVCDRCISEKEKGAILKNAERYLGGDQQSVLNTIKSSLVNSIYDLRLNDAFEELGKLREQTNRLNTRYAGNEDKLLQAGGERAKELQNRIDKLIGEIGISTSELQKIESKDEFDEQLTEDNNIHKADLEYRKYEQKIASATRTNTALRKKEIIESLVLSIKEQATAELKRELIQKTNEKLQKVIDDDYIEIENIDRYIKLKGRAGASEGQTLGIAYCFLGTLFEDAELEFPFIIDSPTGKMDFDKRQAVADIIAGAFNQMVAFVQSAEVERFADRFYNKTDTQYLTIIASPQEKGVEVHEGKEFFDCYQREHKGDENNAF